MKRTERRTYKATGVEARTDSGELHLVGYAAKFNSPSRPLPFIETIAPGAFRKTLSENPDVRFLKNHAGTPMARTKNGTLTLKEDDIGLWFDATLSDTTESRDCYATVERGDMDGMSFTFKAIRQNWNRDRSERSLTEISLADADVGPVTYPAYYDTLVEARDLISALSSEGAVVSTEDLAALQAAYEMARTGLGKLMSLEADGYGQGEDEQSSLMYLMDSVNSLSAWRAMENWEGAPVPSLVAESNSAEPTGDVTPKMTLRLAQAMASRL